MRGLAALAFCTLIIILLSGCAPQRTETLRVSNRSNAIDAVLAIRETDATVGTPTEVFLVSKGTTALDTPVFRADRVDGIKLEWVDESQLTIHANVARVFHHLPTIEVVKPTDRKKVTVNIHLDIKRKE